MVCGTYMDVAGVNPFEVDHVSDSKLAISSKDSIQNIAQRVMSHKEHRCL
jgi:hypothetical protein